eukprot:1143782-Pelagomonas_calceolata.AAC.1
MSARALQESQGKVLSASLGVFGEAQRTNDLLFKFVGARKFKYLELQQSIAKSVPQKIKNYLVFLVDKGKQCLHPPHGSFLGQHLAQQQISTGNMRQLELGLGAASGSLEKASPPKC